MNLKSLLAVFIIVGIGIMLLRTESGLSYASNALAFLNVRVGNFVSGLFGAGGTWGGEGDFRTVMTVDKSSFVEQNYQVTNSTLSASGIAEGTIKIGSVDLHKEEMSVDLQVQGAKGEVEYTIAETLKFDGTAKKIIAGGNTYSSSKGDLKVSFEMVPVGFSLDRLSDRKITIESATGSIARLNEDGSIKSTEELAAEKVEISRFAGSLSLKGSTIRLDGTASSVKGTGEQSSFAW